MVNAENADFDSTVFISNYNNITVISSGLNSSFNTTAELKIKGLTWEATPVVYRNGVLCSWPQCSNVSYQNGVATFNVTGFSSYTTSGNARLEIWDSTDAGMYNAGKVINISDWADFYANYTKKNNDSSWHNQVICQINLKATNIL